MKKLTLTSMLTAAFVMTLCCSLTPLVSADQETERGDLQRNTDKQIQDLKTKIDQVRSDHKADGLRVDQKIKEYENRIEDIKRDSKGKMEHMDDKVDNDRNAMRNTEMDRNGDRRAEMDRNANKNSDAYATTGKRETINDVSKDFNEWRLKRTINSYDDKIDDLRSKAANETNADKKRNLEETVQKLDAKNKAAQAKLNDLRMTNGENWDRIEQELDANLKDIDRDYNNARDIK
jgi:hypothetical protein